MSVRYSTVGASCIRPGIQVHKGWKLKEIIEPENGVEGISEDGQSGKGSFLNGCDGLMFVSRVLILAKYGMSEEVAPILN